MLTLYGQIFEYIRKYVFNNNKLADDNIYYLSYDMN